MKAKASFKHALGKLRNARHFIREAKPDEEEAVIRSIGEASAYLFKRHSEVPLPRDRIPYADLPAVAVHTTAQEFMDKSMSHFAKPNSWVSWANERGKLMDSLQPLIVNFRKREDSKDGSDENVGVVAVESDAIFNANVGENDLKPFGSSFLHVPTGFILHKWESDSAAHRFSSALSLLWQNIFEYQTKGLYVPVVITMEVEGAKISVSAPVPLLSFNYNTALSLPGPEAPKTMIALSAQHLATSLGLAATARLSLHCGVDGRHYVMTVASATVPLHLEHGLDKATATANDQQFILRSEAVAIARYHPTAGPTPPSWYDFIVSVQIPLAIGDLVDEVKKFQASNSPSAEVVTHYIQNGLLSTVLHRHGVNMKFLSTILAKLIGTDADQAALKAEISEDHKTILVEVLKTEQLGRVAKRFVRSDMKRADEINSTTSRIDVVNRVVRLLMAKKEDFWTEHIVPGIKKQFPIRNSGSEGDVIAATEATIAVNIADVKLSNVLKIVSLTVSIEYSGEQGRFAQFTRGPARNLSVGVPLYLQSITEDSKMATLAADMYSEADKLEDGKKWSREHRAELVRCAVAALLSRTSEQHLPTRIGAMKEVEAFPGQDLEILKLYALQLGVGASSVVTTTFNDLLLKQMTPKEIPADQTAEYNQDALLAAHLLDTSMCQRSTDGISFQLCAVVSARFLKIANLYLHIATPCEHTLKSLCDLLLVPNSGLQTSNVYQQEGSSESCAGTPSMHDTMTRAQEVASVTSPETAVALMTMYFAKLCRSDLLPQMSESFTTMAAKQASANHRTCVELYGPCNADSLMALYAATVLVLSVIPDLESLNPSPNVARSSLKKVMEKSVEFDAEKQWKAGCSTVPITLMYRAAPWVGMIEEKIKTDDEKEDPRNASQSAETLQERIMEHIVAAKEPFFAATFLQRIGKGLLARAQLARENPNTRSVSQKKQSSVQSSVATDDQSGTGSNSGSGSLNGSQKPLERYASASMTSVPESVAWSTAASPTNSDIINDSPAKEQWIAYHKTLASGEGGKESRTVSLEFITACVTCFTELCEKNVTRYTALKEITHRRMTEMINKTPEFWAEERQFIDAFKRKACNIVKETVISPHIVPDGISVTDAERVQLVSESSFIEKNELAFVHVWKCRREAKRFQLALQSLTQVREELCVQHPIHAPFSINILHQGKCVTVTWLLPLISEDAIRVHPDSLLDRLSQMYRAALGGYGPQAAVPKDPIPFYGGADGNVYMFGVEDVLFNKFRTHTVAMTDRVGLRRPEFLLQDSQTTEGIPVHETTMPLRRCVDTFISLMNDPKDVFKEAPPRAIPKVCHSNGLNLSELHKILADKKMVTFDLPTKGSFMKAVNTQMTGRTLRTLFEVAAAEMCANVDDPFIAKEVVERTVADFIKKFMKTSAFLYANVMPILRQKYSTPPEYLFTSQQVSLTRAIALAATKFSIDYDHKTKEVKGFLPPQAVSCTSPQDPASAPWRMKDRLAEVEKLFGMSTDVIPLQLANMGTALYICFSASSRTKVVRGYTSKASTVVAQWLKSDPPAFALINGVLREIRSAAAGRVDHNSLAREFSALQTTGRECDSFYYLARARVQYDVSSGNPNSHIHLSQSRAMENASGSPHSGSESGQTSATLTPRLQSSANLGADGARDPQQLTPENALLFALTSARKIVQSETTKGFIVDDTLDWLFSGITDIKLMEFVEGKGLINLCALIRDANYETLVADINARQEGNTAPKSIDEIRHVYHNQCFSVIARACSSRELSLITDEKAKALSVIALAHSSSDCIKFAVTTYPPTANPRPMALAFYCIQHLSHTFLVSTGLTHDDVDALLAPIIKNELVLLDSLVGNSASLDFFISCTFGELTDAFADACERLTDASDVSWRLVRTCIRVAIDTYNKKTELCDRLKPLIAQDGRSARQATASLNASATSQPANEAAEKRKKDRELAERRLAEAEAAEREKREKEQEEKRRQEEQEEAARKQREEAERLEREEAEKREAEQQQEAEKDTERQRLEDERKAGAEAAEKEKQERERREEEDRKALERQRLEEALLSLQTEESSQRQQLEASWQQEATSIVKEHADEAQRIRESGKESSTAKSGEPTRPQTGERSPPRTVATPPPADDQSTKAAATTTTTQNTKIDIVVLRRRLVRFYTKYQPENVNNVDRFMGRFAGCEQTLVDKLADKYPESPMDYPFSDDAEHAKDAPPAEAAPKAEVNDDAAEREEKAEADRQAAAAEEQCKKDEEEERARKEQEEKERHEKQEAERKQREQEEADRQKKLEEEQQRREQEEKERREEEERKAALEREESEKRAKEAEAEKLRKTAAEARAKEEEERKRQQQEEADRKALQEQRDREAAEERAAFEKREREERERQEKEEREREELEKKREKEEADRKAREEEELRQLELQRAREDDDRKRKEEAERKEAEEKAQKAKSEEEAQRIRKEEAARQEKLAAERKALLEKRRIDDKHRKEREALCSEQDSQRNELEDNQLFNWTQLLSEEQDGRHAILDAERKVKAERNLKRVEEAREYERQQEKARSERLAQKSPTPLEPDTVSSGSHTSRRHHHRPAVESDVIVEGNEDNTVISFSYKDTATTSPYRTRSPANYSRLKKSKSPARSISSLTSKEVIASAQDEAMRSVLLDVSRVKLEPVRIDESLPLSDQIKQLSQHKFILSSLVKGGASKRVMKTVSPVFKKTKRSKVSASTPSPTKAFGENTRRDGSRSPSPRRASTTTPLRTGYDDNDASPILSPSHYDSVNSRSPRTSASPPKTMTVDEIRRRMEEVEKSAEKQFKYFSLAGKKKPPTRLPKLGTGGSRSTSPAASPSPKKKDFTRRNKF